MADQLTKREYSAYLNKALGRSRKTLPTHIQVTRTDETGRQYQDIVADPDELKELLRETTWTELGTPHRKKWYAQMKHNIADMTEHGNRLRRTLSHGSPGEREAAIRRRGDFPIPRHGPARGHRSGGQEEGTDSGAHETDGRHFGHQRPVGDVLGDRREVPLLRRAK